jgi:hypothetical protein
MCGEDITITGLAVDSCKKIDLKQSSYRIATVEVCSAGLSAGIDLLELILAGLELQL